MVAYDKKLLTPLLKHLDWTIPDLDMKLVYVAPGTFRMGANDGELDEKPVECVSWDDAKKFCIKLNMRERKAGRLPAVHQTASCTIWDFVLSLPKNLNGNILDAAAFNEFGV